MSHVGKSGLPKSVLKRHQSTRKLSRKLTAKQHAVSKSAVHRYLRHCLQLKLLKLRRQPGLTAAQRQKRLDFARGRPSPQLVHPGLEAGALLRRVSLWVVPPAEAPKRPCLGQHQLRSAQPPHCEAGDQGDCLELDELLWPLEPPHRAPWQNRHIGFLHGGSAEWDGDIGDEATNGEWALGIQQLSHQTSARHVADHFSAGRSPSSHRRQDPALALGQLPCLLGEGSMVSQLPVAHRKPLGDRPGQGRQDVPGDLRNHPHRKRSLGQAQHLGKGAGQPDVWDAGAHEGLCGEV